MQRTSVCLWFDGTAEEAARFYTSLVDDGRVEGTLAAPDGIPDTRPGDPVTVEFSLNGQHFVALNGGPQFSFSEAASIMLTVDSQEEVDRLWAALTADGGAEGQCGWCTDRFGLSWQIVPRRLDELLADPDRARAARVTRAMLGMRKLVIADLESA